MYRPKTNRPPGWLATGVQLGPWRPAARVRVACAAHGVSISAVTHGWRSEATCCLWCAHMRAATHAGTHTGAHARVRTQDAKSKDTPAMVTIRQGRLDLARLLIAASKKVGAAPWWARTLQHG